MPEPAVQLNIWLRGVGYEEQERVAEEDIYEYNFAICNEREPADGKEFQTYAFEETEENINLMNGLKSHLQERFPEADVDLSAAGSGSSFDDSSPVQKSYRITVDARAEDENIQE